MSLALSLRGGEPSRVSTPLLAVALHSGGVFPRVLDALDKLYGGVLSLAVKQADFKGGRDESLLFVGNGRGPARVLLVGLAENDDAYAAITRAATLAGRKGNAMGVRRMAFWAPQLSGDSVEAAAFGLSRGSWELMDYKTQPPVRDRPRPLVEAAVVSSDLRASRAAFAAGVALGARHWRSPPPPRARVRSPRDHTPEDGVVPRGGAGNATGSQAHRRGVS